MDATLDEIADALLNQRLPDNWRKLAPETCMQLAAWLNHLQVNRFTFRKPRVPYIVYRLPCSSTFENVIFTCYVHCALIFRAYCVS